MPVGGVVPLDDWSTPPGAVLVLELSVVVVVVLLVEVLPLSVVQLQASFICCCVEPSCLASCWAMHSCCVIWLFPVVSEGVVDELDDADAAGAVVDCENAGAPATAATAAMIAGVRYFMVEPP